MKMLLAIFLGLIGLLMSSCGVIFLFAADLKAVAPISVPSVVVGALLLWAAWALWKSWRRGNANPQERKEDNTP